MGAYTNPDLPANTKIHDLTPFAESDQQLTPETSVVVINRGAEMLVRKFDGRDYPLRSHVQGHMRMPYGAALHFQKHCTVPGTRNAETNEEQSYIGILNVDADEACEPFTPEQCASFGQRIEALQREDGDEVRTVPVNAAMATGKIPTGRGKSTSRGKGVAFASEGIAANGSRVSRDDMMHADETAQERIDRLNAEEGAEA